MAPFLAHADSEMLCARLLSASFELPLSATATNISPTWLHIEKNLRTIIRTGWKKRGIPLELGESILEHSQKLRQAALLYAPHVSGAKVEEAATMALIHDLAEGFDMQDYTHEAGLTLQEKMQIETQTWEKLVQLIPEATPLFQLWLEYAAGKSPNARFIKQLDKLDAVIQALKYEKLGYTSIVDFYTDPRKKLTDPTLLKIFDILMEKKFPLVNVYEQYFKLLELNGDEIIFQQLMEARTQEILNDLEAAKKL